MGCNKGVLNCEIHIRPVCYYNFKLLRTRADYSLLCLTEYFWETYCFPLWPCFFFWATHMCHISFDYVLNVHWKLFLQHLHSLQNRVMGKIGSSDSVLWFWLINWFENCHETFSLEFDRNIIPRIWNKSKRLSINGSNYWQAQVSSYFDSKKKLSV